MSVPAGARRLAPGVYSCGGELHVDAVELCEAAGVVASEENQELLAQAAVRVAVQRGVAVQVVDG